MTLETTFPREAPIASIHAISPATSKSPPFFPVALPIPTVIVVRKRSTNPVIEQSSTRGQWLSPFSYRCNRYNRKPVLSEFRVFWPDLAKSSARKNDSLNKGLRLLVRPAREHALRHSRPSAHSPALRGEYHGPTWLLALQPLTRVNHEPWSATASARWMPRSTAKR